MKTTTIGILGSGGVGQALGHGFATLGHSVKIGSRERDNPKLKGWVAEHGKNASQGTFAEAASFGEVVVVATLWEGTVEALKAAEEGAKGAFRGKIVLDVTNPLKLEGGRPVGLERGFSDSGGEQIQRWLPDAKVVKVFNTVGSPHMFKPSFPGGPPDMFFCGNDAGAKQTVTELLHDFGWNPIDIGGLEGARMLEPMCWLWVTYGARGNGWNHAFKLLKK